MTTRNNLKTNIQVCVRLRPLLVTDTVSATTTTTTTTTTTASKPNKRRVKKPNQQQQQVGRRRNNDEQSSSAPQDFERNSRGSRLRPPSSSSSSRSLMSSTRQMSKRRIGATRVESKKNTTQEEEEEEERTTANVMQHQQQQHHLIPAWEVDSSAQTIHQSAHTYNNSSNNNNSTPPSFTFDHVYSPKTPTSTLYTQSVQALVHASMRGYHSSVFAYGQTSTGKTYTMTGTPSDPGVVPLAVRDCFRFVRQGGANGTTSSFIEQKEEREFLLRVSYMEIYNESIHDLLSNEEPASSSSGIRIFESREEGVVVRGLKEEVVTSPSQVFALLSLGESRRRTGATGLNRFSSRSHSIFRLVIESRARTTSFSSPSSHATNCNKVLSLEKDPNLTGPIRVSSLSLVDLAGSESVKATGCTGARQKEGQYINKSLMTLGHVIWKLSEMADKTPPSSTATTTTTNTTSSQFTNNPNHIPYRDSKLTRLLQPSLSGNAQICIICNVSPMVRNLEESLNTLKFASRAKRIRQRAKLNEVLDNPTLLRNYREEIDFLKKELMEAREAQRKLQEERERDNNKEGQTTTTTTSIASSNHQHHEQDEDVDTMVLVEAIRNLEKLILKTSSFSLSSNITRNKSTTAKANRNRNGSFFSSDAGIMALLTESDDEEDDEEDDHHHGQSKKQVSSLPSSSIVKKNITQSMPPADNNLINDSSLTTIDHHEEKKMETLILSPPKPLPHNKKLEQQEEDNDEGEDDDAAGSLLADLRRIQNLLGSVLKKKGTTSPEKAVLPSLSSPAQQQSPLSPLNQKQVSGQTSSCPDISSITPQINNDSTTEVLPNTHNNVQKQQELEKMKIKLHDQEVASKLWKADSTFLQNQLAEKDHLLNEVSTILSAVERRQTELETENSRMRTSLARKTMLLAKRDKEVATLKAELVDRDELFSDLV